jgi:hypothetical protein
MDTLGDAVCPQLIFVNLDEAEKKNYLDNFI